MSLTFEGYRQKQAEIEAWELKYAKNWNDFLFTTGGILCRYLSAASNCRYLNMSKGLGSIYGIRSCKQNAVIFLTEKYI